MSRGQLKKVTYLVEVADTEVEEALVDVADEATEDPAHNSEVYLDSESKQEEFPKSGRRGAARRDHTLIVPDVNRDFQDDWEISI